MSKDLTKYIPADASSESNHTPVSIENSKREITPANNYRPVQNGTEDKDLDDDFQEIRRRLISANILAENAVKEAIDLAKSSDNPGAWQVVGELIKNLTKINETLVKSHKEKIRAKNEIRSDNSNQPPKTQTNIQNNYYASPAEIAEKIRMKREASE